MAEAATPRHVTSRDNPLLVRLRKLASDPGAYRRTGLIWIEGEHLCAALVARGGRPEQAVVTRSAWESQPGLHGLARRAATVVVVEDALMATLGTLESPAPIGFVVAWPGAAALVPGRPSVVLDRVQDAGNVGAIVRSAAAFGVTQVIALKGSAALWSPKVLRAGMGAHFALHLVEAAEADALDAIGVPLIATSSHAVDVLQSAELPWPCGWVFGHEGQGIAGRLLQRCARTLRIAQPGGEESLNVAAAAAVCLYESTRRRVTLPPAAPRPSSA
ncbi:MAG: RNA methyltransferase [Proteobacteria bacterium]|nr:RNA methyltransferase [Pseudomonadota bacterium]